MPYKTLNITLNRIIATALVIMITVIVFISYDMYTVYTSPQFDSCVELSKHVQDITSRECINYVSEHPYATGEDIVDHFYDVDPPKTLEELLTSKMIP